MKQKQLIGIKLTALLIALAAFVYTSQSQIVTANWTSGGGDGLWNTAANWDQSLVPGVDTNAVINGFTVFYDGPMTAPNIANLTLGGTATTLLITNSGFNVATNTTLNASATLTIGAGGVMTNNLLNQASQTADLVNVSGGTVTNGNTAISNNGSNDGGTFNVNSGIASLGNVTIRRSGNNVFGNGLNVYGGVVYASLITIGTGNSYCTMNVGGGAVTNSGKFQIGFGNASARRSFFNQTNGVVVCNDTVDVGGNTNQLAWFTLSNPQARFFANGIRMLAPINATVTGITAGLTNGGTLYLGSGGFIVLSNTAGTYSVTLSDQGLLGASTDWTGTVDALLRSGNFTFQAADANGVAHNINWSGRLSGSGSLVKTGGGVLSLQTNNTFSGATLISEGTLSLGANGSISNTTVITISSGATLDASAVSGGFPLGASRTLQGFGTVSGNLSAASGSTISPGSNVVTGTLTLGTVTESGGAINKFDLSTNPSGPNNDFIVINGDFNVSGANSVQVSGGGAPGSVHPLIQYSGNLNGSLSSLTLVGASGVLSNNATTKTIYLVIQSAVRPPTSNVVWQGNPTVNDWDLLVHTNWLTNGVTTYFVSGDSVVFDATGAANPNVNIVGSVDPATVLVNAAANYTFGGSGNISGSGTSLVKSNSGTVTILTTNSYTGPTTIAGGALEVTTVANGGNISGIGAAPAASANLVLDSGTLRYLGGTISTDRGATLNAGGGTIGVTNAASTLTVSGTLTGAGSLTKTGPGTLILSAGDNYAGGTVISNGVLQINNATGAGTGNITNVGATLRFNSALTVNNVLDFEGACKLEISGVGGGNIALRGAWSGNGTVDVNFLTQNAAQTFSIGGEGSGGGNMTNFFGTVNFGTNTGFVRLNNNETFNIGSSNVTFNLGAGNVLFSQRNGNTTTFLGGLAGGPYTKLSGSRSDTPGLEIYMIGGNNLSTTFDGMITNGIAASSTVRIIKVGTGTLTLGGTNVYTGTTIISNGVLALSGFGSISNTPSISLLTNTVLDVSTRTDGAIALNSGQTLQGSGTVRGSVIVGSGATLAVGDDLNIPEAMTITNVLTLQSGGNLNMDVDHYQYYAGLTNDVIQGLASVTYGGVLNLNILSIETNSVFKLFSAAHYNGAFESINPPTPPFSGLVWDTSKLTVDGTLRLATPQVTVGITLSGSDLILVGSNGTPFGAFNLLSTADLSLPLNQWTLVQSGNFDASGSVTLTLTGAVNPAQPQQFYLLQQ
jgi:fibronectin-binding autotransporter adhesin